MSNPNILRYRWTHTQCIDCGWKYDLFTGSVGGATFAVGSLLEAYQICCNHTSICYHGTSSQAEGVFTIQAAKDFLKKHDAVLVINHQEINSYE